MFECMSDFLFTIYYLTEFITSHNIQNDAHFKRHKHAKVEIKTKINTTNNQGQQYLIVFFTRSTQTKGNTDTLNNN